MITVAHLKGGTGKTTTVAHLVLALAEDGARVLAVDADGQGSLVGWAEDAHAGGLEWPDAVSLPTRTLHRQLPGIARGYEHVVIDTPNDPSRDQAVVASAMRASELVVIPVAPAPLEFERLSPTLEVVEDAKVINDRLRAVVLLSRIRASTRSAGQARGVLEDQGLHVLAAEVPLREAIAQSAGGATPAEAYRAVAAELGELATPVEVSA